MKTLFWHTLSKLFFFLSHQLNVLIYRLDKAERTVSKVAWRCHQRNVLDTRWNSNPPF